jgi:hypothetical protein
MDAPLLPIAATALVSILAAVVACHWWFSRKLAVLRQRLHRSEQARHAAHERSNQARTQINQLSKAIADLERRLKVTVESERKRADLDRLVPALSDGGAVPPNGFPDTQPL